jgi:hypothetical protein
MNAELKLSVLHADGTSHDCTLAVAQTSPNAFTLRYQSDSIGSLIFSGTDAFNCLLELRRHLETFGHMIVCNGARLNAWPSQMCRQSAGGFKVYLLQLNQPARIDDLVWTFDSTNTASIGTVDGQVAFYRAWQASLGTSEQAER